MTKVAFNGAEKIISILPQYSEINLRIDVYSVWKRWAAAGNLRFQPAFRYAGGDTIIDTQKSLEVFILVNGWKIRANHDCTIDGTVLTDNGTTPFIAGQNQNLVMIANRTANQSGSAVSNAPSTAQIASAVRAELTPELSRIDASISSIQTSSNGSGLTATQATMLLEMYALMGLDPTKPLVVTANSRTAGDVYQSINSSQTETIVMRQ